MNRKSHLLIWIVAAITAGCLQQDLDTADQTPPEFDPDYGTGQVEMLALADGEIVFLDRGEGEPVVFYGGIPYWQWQVEEVSETYNAIAISYTDIAHLRSPQGLDAALEALNLGPVHLVAHSSTGWPAVQLVAERPELFRSLVLEEIAVFDLSGAPAQTCSLTDVSNAEVAACEFSSQVSGPGWFESWPMEIRHFVTEMMAEASASPPEPQIDLPAQDMAIPSLCDEELRSAVSQSDLPILFVRGEQTPSFLQAELDEYEACTPLTDSVTVSDAAHFVHLDQPAEFNRAIMAFFEQIDRR
jgi:pimeloyl-ACP methyl ester carboxylesterase